MSTEFVAVGFTILFTIVTSVPPAPISIDPLTVKVDPAATVNWPAVIRTLLEIVNADVAVDQSPAPAITN